MNDNAKTKDEQPAEGSDESTLTPQASASVTDDSPIKGLPPLSRDRSFIGMTVTQFLGAFNDNLFKQLLLLIALDYKEMRGLETDPYQTYATLAFSIPFVLLSGFGGYVSDKVRKRSVVIFCKMLEILVMLAAMIAFFTGTMGAESFIISLMVVLFFMGAQSAIFGPSKFGILPEMLRERDLPLANAIIQMTTFLAIILGTALSGVLKDAMPNQLWVISVVCVAIAIAGTCTALLVRKTPIANPNLKFTADCLVVEKEAFRFIRSDGPLMRTMFIYALFWFAGAVIMMSVNSVCRTQLGFSSTVTSLLSTCMGIGIAIGCMVCGKLCKGQVRFDLVRVGAWGLFVATGMASTACILPMANGHVQAWMIGGSLLLIGFFAGIFAVPPQVFIQARPPEAFKGRVIGAMALTTWIGICIASGYYFLYTKFAAATGLVYSWIFLSVGFMFVLVAVLFRQPNPPVGESSGKPVVKQKST